MLRDLQSAFLEGVFGDANEAALGAIDDDEIGAKRRFSIYRDNTFISLRKVLSACFPAVERLVGERFFAYSAREFVKDHPPRVPQMLAYGDTFPGFLDRFPPAASVPYLGDVARLEWARNEALFAADAPTLGAEALKAYPTEQYGDLRFYLHPTVRRVTSRYPIQSIWQANQQDKVARVDVNGGGEQVLVLRPSHKVIAIAIEPGDNALLASLGRGDSLDVAAERALGIDGGFDLQAALVAHLKRGSFSGVNL